MAISNIEALRSLSAYPIPLRTIVEVSERRNIDLMAEATAESLRSKEYRLATADLLLWLSYAPDISQGGQSYSINSEQQKQMRSEAMAIYEELDKEIIAGCPKFGYKGSRL